MNTPARIDPVTLEVLRGRFDAVADEMEHAILRSAYSTIVTEALDATAAVFDARGRTVSQACAIPVHLGTLTELGLRFAAAYPAGVAKPGDLYMINDPYCGGTHLPDIAVAAPVFCAGELVGYVATMTHHQDVGGAAPGSTSTNVYDHHSEGLRIPMLRFGEGGRIDEDVLALLTANSRSPHNMRGDLMAQVAGCATGERRLAAVFADYGIAPVRAAIDALMDYAERLTRLAIDAIPDGEYSFTDWLDNDGTETGTEPVRIQVAIRVQGTAVEFDFDGSAPQVRSAINNVASSTLAAVYYAIRTLTGDAAPNNDGCYRPITLKLPEASVVNAAYPAPINARGVALARIADVVMGAMAKAVPAKMPAAGCGHATVIHAGAFDRETGKRIIGALGGPLRGGMGARPTKDGIDVADHDLSNSYHVPIEVTEREFPVRYHTLALWTDSGGPGRYRGGLGYRVELEWLKGEASLALRRERHVFRPWGIHGGGCAPTCRTELRRVDGSVETVPAKTVLQIRAGETLCYWSTGGGGAFPAGLRDPAAVRDDVLDGRVSARSAFDDYGVVLRDGQVDAAATAERRATMPPGVTSGAPA
jgi:N-methylhydantoinase B/oxoprolinase/acetone carboxylase alpha subunit